MVPVGGPTRYHVPMQHSPAGLHVARPATRFVGPAARDRERSLGLQRHALSMIAARPSGAAAGPAGAPRYSLRDRRVLTIVPPRREVSGTLRRQPSLAWAASSREGHRWTALLAPTPWRG